MIDDVSKNLFDLAPMTIEEMVEKGSPDIPKTALISRKEATKINRKTMHRYLKNLYLAEGLGEFFMSKVTAKKPKQRKR